jgi:hypothetical protein
MNLVDQLLELTALHQSGALDDGEYRDAKASVIASSRHAAAPASAAAAEGRRTAGAPNLSADATIAFPDDPDATLAFTDMTSTRLGDMSALDSDATQPFHAIITERSIDLSSDTIPFPSPGGSPTADPASEGNGSDPTITTGTIVTLTTALREIKSELQAESVAEPEAAAAPAPPSKQQLPRDPQIGTTELGGLDMGSVRRENLLLFRDDPSGTGMVQLSLQDSRLSDKQLDAIAAAAPTNSQELLAVKGVGRTSVKKWGEKILRIVALPDIQSEETLCDASAQNEDSDAESDLELSVLEEADGDDEDIAPSDALEASADESCSEIDLTTDIALSDLDSDSDSDQSEDDAGHDNAVLPAPPSLVGTAPEKLIGMQIRLNGLQRMPHLNGRVVTVGEPALAEKDDETHYYVLDRFGQQLEYKIPSAPSHEDIDMHVRHQAPGIEYETGPMCFHPRFMIPAGKVTATDKTEPGDHVDVQEASPEEQKKIDAYTEERDNYEFRRRQLSFRRDWQPTSTNANSEQFQLSLNGSRLSDEQLDAIAMAKPHTTKELLAVDGVGSATVKKWGDKIVQIIATCEIEDSDSDQSSNSEIDLTTDLALSDADTDADSDLDLSGLDEEEARVVFSDSDEDITNVADDILVDEATTDSRIAPVHSRSGSEQLADVRLNKDYQGFVKTRKTTWRELRTKRTPAEARVSCRDKTAAQHGASDTMAAQQQQRQPRRTALGEVDGNGLTKSSSSSKSAASKDYEPLRQLYYTNCVCAGSFRVACVIVCSTSMFDKFWVKVRKAGLNKMYSRKEVKGFMERQTPEQVLKEYTMWSGHTEEQAAKEFGPFVKSAAGASVKSPTEKLFHGLGVRTVETHFAASGSGGLRLG